MCAETVSHHVLYDEYLEPLGVSFVINGKQKIALFSKRGVAFDWASLSNAEFIEKYSKEKKKWN